MIDINPETAAWIPQLISLVVSFIQIFLELLYMCMLVWVITSWVSPRGSQFQRYLGQIVNPILKPFRWARVGMIDFSPILALLFLSFAGNAIVGLLLWFVR